MPAGGDVRQRHLVAPAGRAAGDRVAECDHRRVQPQLEDGIDPHPALTFELLQRIEIPRVDHNRLLANRVRARAQRQADVRVVQVVRRADADVVHALLFRGPPQLLAMAIETLDLGEEPYAERITIEQPDGVGRIRRGDPTMPGVANGIQVPRRHESGAARYRKVHDTAVLCPSALVPDPWLTTVPWPASAAPNTAATRGAVTCNE